MSLPTIQSPTKHRGFIVTYTGKKFYPLEPNPNDVDIRDIAHALSNMCRWGGHVMRFYSVAQHSVILADYALNQGNNTTMVASAALLMLLHDASEAYFADICRPVKELLPGIKEIEHNLDKCIASVFGLQWPWPDFVKELDTQILEDERSQLTNCGFIKYPNSLNIVIEECWTPNRAMGEFMKMYNKVRNK
jgi:uncharacterized protein